MSDLPALLPLPSTLQLLSGSTGFGPDARIAWRGPQARDCAELLAEYLRPATGFAWTVVPASKQSEAVTLLQTDDPQPDAAGFLPESYTLEAADGAVRVEAPSGAGLARGIQTLRQLLPAAVYADTKQDADWSLPACRIEDAPRFRWRGLHLDVSRHFFCVEDVCRFIELLAQHRLNVCHLHLTDDQGWRVEIRRYPRLTEIGARRACTLVGHESARPRRYDGTPYGGFYTQDDLRRIVAFAARRHVTIVPEIDMPGHMVAAIAAYPELGNFDARLEPRRHWGISQSVLNVEDSTVAFMRNVLEELLDIFPSRFIHVGGDEAPKREWSESARAQELMAARGLRNEDELQSWFIRQMDGFLSEHGRRLIGWDEILEGGLAEGAAVMSWRGEDGGIAAAREGHDVVMAPQHSVYFDYYQDEPKREEPLAIGGMTTLAKVYAYPPIPGALQAEHRHHVLGAQGQLWTEYIADRDKLDYMAYPRACALAEVVWTDAGQLQYSNFLERLAVHRARLAVQHVATHPRP
jgi:hexosaminidase